MSTSWPSDLVVVGLGQLGQLYAGGALKLGIRVTPVVRTTPRPLALSALPGHTPILVAVGEDALGGVLEEIPAARRDHVVLLQNELFPSVWRAHGVRSPTVLIPWLSRKKGRPLEVARPTLAYGPHAGLFAAVHGALDLPCEVTTETARMEDGLVAKYTFIITINALGVQEDLTLGAWLRKDPARVDVLAAEAHALGQAQLGRPVPRDDVLRQAREAMAALPDYPARGRTARARIERAVAVAQQRGVHVTELHALVGA
ncbi:MAG: hypothetical protein AB2A00_05240 [Myxococcota bacterium]